MAVTVSVGGSLGLSFGSIADVGLESSVSVTTEEGTTDVAQIECEGPWTCGLIMTPSVLEVSGVQKTTTRGGCDTSTSEAPYTVQFPIKEENTVKATFAACACPNEEHSTDKGAPDLCPKDC